MTRMVYTAASHSTWYDRDGGENERGQKRHDAFDLVLKEHEVPQTTAALRKYWVFYPSERSAMESFRDATCRVSWVGEACCSHDVEVEVSTPYARCPYCGKTDALHDKNWLIYEDVQSQDAQSRSITQCEASNCVEDEEVIAVEYAEYDGWLPMRKGNFKPLLPYRHPFSYSANASSPWECFVTEAHQAKLLFEDFPADNKRHSCGLKDKTFQGLYECPCCQGVFWVFCSDSYLSHSALKVDETAPLINELRYVHVDIVSDERLVAVTFEPRIGEQRIRSLCFDLERGSFMVDGIQLFKGSSFDSANLSIIPLDVQCDALSKTLIEILCEYTSSTQEAIEALVQARIAGETKNMPRALTKSKTFEMRIDERGTFLDLAIANRYRGYPQEFYKHFYGDSKWHVHGTSYIITLKIREATNLPVDYLGIDIDDFFKRSGLPDCKSVRRRVFSQPLLLAGVLEAGRLPFANLDILLTCLIMRRLSITLKCLAMPAARRNRTPLVSSTI